MKKRIPSVKKTLGFDKSEPSDDISRGRTLRFRWFVCGNEEEDEENDIRLEKVDKYRWRTKDSPKI